MSSRFSLLGLVAVWLTSSLAHAGATVEKSYFQMRQQHCAAKSAICSKNFAGKSGVQQISDLNIVQACQAFYQQNHCDEVKNAIGTARAGEIMSCAPSAICKEEVPLDLLECSINGVKLQLSVPNLLLNIGLGVGLSLTSLPASALAIPLTPFLIYSTGEQARQCDADVKYKMMAVKMHNLALSEGERPLDIASQDKALLKMPCSDLNKFLQKRLDVFVEKANEASRWSLQPRVRKLSPAAQALLESLRSNRCLTSQTARVKACEAVAAMIVTGGVGAIAERAAVKLIRAAIPARAVSTAAITPAERLAENEAALTTRVAPPEIRTAYSSNYEAMVKNNLERHGYLVSNANGAQLFHGSNSSSLIGFTGKAPEGLIPTGALVKNGKVPFGGEVANGISKEGINQRALSTVEFGDVDLAVDYAKNYFNSGWNPALSRQKVESLEKIMGPGAKIPGIDPAIEKLRAERWSSLSRQEKKLVEEGFPVLYGIAPASGRSFEGGMLTPSMNHEVGIIGGAAPSEVRVIFVPADKVELVKKLVSGNAQNIRVAPIEPVIKSSWDVQQTKEYLRKTLRGR